MPRSQGVESVQFDLGRIPSGERGTDETLRAIGRLVERSIERQVIRLAALRILDRAGVPNKNDVAAARAIFNWVRTNVRYVQDPPNLETVQAPEITLKLRAGDCDDHAGLVGALLQSIGIPFRFTVTGTDKDRLSHIFVEALLNGRWRPMDTTRTARFGAAVPKLGVTKYFSWKGTPSMSYVTLGANASTATRGYNLDVEKLKALAYRGALKALKNNWAAGLINRSDVVGYLEVIDSGNSPGRGTFAEAPMRQAIADFLAHIDGYGLISGKSEGSTTGLEGLDGFLKSIWNGVKSVVGGAVKLVTGGSTVTVSPPVINIPTTVPPATGQAIVGDLLKSPLVWAALAAIIVLPMMLGRRR